MAANKKRSKRLKKRSEKRIKTPDQTIKKVKKTTAQSMGMQQSVHTISTPPEATREEVSRSLTLMSKKNESKKPFVKLSREQSSKILTTLSSLVLLLGVVWLAFSYIPYLYQFTDKGKVEKIESEAQQKQQQRLVEDQKIASVQQVVIKTSVGDLVFDMLKSQAPTTSDNFLRLALRQKYNDVSFHRLVKQKQFHVIQGGDYTRGDGSGGLAADSSAIKDEMWKLAPSYNEAGGLTNQPQLFVPEAYSDFAILGKDQSGKVQTQITIKKGYVAMAKTAAPDSASSQFFIALNDTTLPAEYTVFARVTDVDSAAFTALSVLNQADTTQSNGSKPEKEVKIVSTYLQ